MINDSHFLFGVLLNKMQNIAYTSASDLQYITSMFFRTNKPGHLINLLNEKVYFSFHQFTVSATPFCTTRY